MATAIGQGTLLQHSTDGVSYTTIATLIEIGEISMGEADVVDITNHDSVNGYRDKIRGLIDAGEISFTAIWSGAASQLTAITRLVTGPTSTLDYIKVTFPSSLGTWTARGFFKNAALNPQLDDTIQLTGAIEVSGKPTFSVP